MTERLQLRGWQETDRAPFASMNADPEVMEFFPSVITRQDSDAMIDRFEAERAEVGFCPWAVELLETSEFVGFVGLHRVPAYLAAAPGVEVGWRLARRFWGFGFATEAAKASMAFGFQRMGLSEIVAFTSAINLRSRRVMERLGMVHDLGGGFEHPKVPDGPLKAHVLYRVRR